MLRMYPQTSPDDAKAYYAKADYYIDSQERVGDWGGKGAERLGLGGVVGRDDSTRCAITSIRRRASGSRRGRVLIAQWL